MKTYFLSIPSYLVRKPIWASINGNTFENKEHLYQALERAFIDPERMDTDLCQFTKAELFTAYISHVSLPHALAVVHLIHDEYWDADGTDEDEIETETPATLAVVLNAETSEQTLKQQFKRAAIKLAFHQHPFFESETEISLQQWADEYDRLVNDPNLYFAVDADGNDLYYLSTDFEMIEMDSALLIAYERAEDAHYAMEK